MIGGMAKKAVYVLDASPACISFPVLVSLRRSPPLMAEPLLRIAPVRYCSSPRERAHICHAAARCVPARHVRQMQQGPLGADMEPFALVRVVRGASHEPATSPGILAPWVRPTTRQPSRSTRRERRPGERAATRPTRSGTMGISAQLRTSCKGFARGAAMRGLRIHSVCTRPCWFRPRAMHTLRSPRRPSIRASLRPRTPPPLPAKACIPTASGGAR